MTTRLPGDQYDTGAVLVGQHNPGEGVEMSARAAADIARQFAKRKEAMSKKPNEPNRTWYTQTWYICIIAVVLISMLLDAGNHSATALGGWVIALTVCATARIRESRRMGVDRLNKWGDVQ